MIMYKKYKISLENYILDRCVNQIRFSLQVKKNFNMKNNLKIEKA